MRFVERMNVARIGKDVDDFALTFTDDQARERLCLQKVPHTLCEYLSCPNGEPRMAAPGKFFLDRDVYLGPDPPSEEVMAFHLKEVVDNLQILIDLFAGVNVHVTCKIATRHGFCVKRNEHKASFRPFFLGMRLRYTDILRIIKLKQPAGFWDPTVYKPKEQLLAAINGCKSQTDLRVLTPACPTDDPLDYVVQHVPLEWPFLDMPIESVVGETEDADAETDVRTDVEQGSEVSGPSHAAVVGRENEGFENPVFIRDLLACLSAETANDRKRWIDIGYVLRGIRSENEGGYDGWEDFLKFSKIGERTYDGERECRRQWDSLRTGSRGSGASCTIGTLIHWAKIDNPAAYDVARRANNKRKRDQAGALLVSRYLFRDDGEKVEKYNSTEAAGFDLSLSANNDAWCYGEALLKLDAVFFAGMSEETFSITPQHNLLCTFADTKISMEGTIAFPDCTVRVRGNIVGQLAPDFRVRHLKRFNLGIDDLCEFSVTRVIEQDVDRMMLRGVGADTAIDIFDIRGEKDSPAIVRLNGKESFVNAKKLSLLKDALTEQGYRHIEERIGAARGSAANYFAITVNNTINVFNCVDPDQLRTTDNQLIITLMSAKPEIKQRFRFAPDAKSSQCNGLFYCDPFTNVWSQVHNAFVEEYLVESILHGATLSTADDRFVNTQRAGGELRKILVRKVIDVGFEISLDANLDVFPVSNGVFVLEEGIVTGFRAIEPTDLVVTTAGWAYDAGRAADKRAEVETFLAQVFPLADERRVVLSYIAHLMSGRRSVKKFLVMTDRRSGNNGKSTFAKLLMMFFGSLSKSSTKFVCKGSFDKDRDSHDGGLEPFKGKRLVVAEELKHTMTIDEAMLKAYSGGGGTIVEGRKVGSGDWFKFVWQAGFILIFNEGDCPKFDAADQAFVGRMIVAPMRSKFVAGAASVPVVGIDLDPEPFTYPMDMAIETKFESWLPALANVFIAHQDMTVLTNVPASMSEWRQNVAENANPLSEWLMARVEVTLDKSDYILLMEMKTAYFAGSSKRTIAEKDFTKLAKGCLGQIPGVSFKEQDWINKAVRNVVRGVKRASAFAEDYNDVSL